MPQQPTPSDDYLDTIARLERRVAELERRTLRNVVIPEGGIKVLGGGIIRAETADGIEMFYLGPLYSSGQQFAGYLLHREDGSVLLGNGIIGTDTSKVFLVWKDRVGNTVVLDDAVHGQGLAKPWLGMPTAPVLATSIPVTTGMTWISVYSTGWVLKQQPQIEAQALLYSTGGGVGEARFMINGVQHGTTMPIASGAFNWSSLQQFLSPNNYGTYIRLELQVQRTNGAGSVGGVLIATQRGA